VREHYGAFAPQAAALRIRHDHGSQYMSGHIQKELLSLGLESLPAFLREPEGNDFLIALARRRRRFPMSSQKVPAVSNVFPGPSKNSFFGSATLKPPRS
jgi:hypothetical protein